jgi:hypothetical protein
MSPKTRLPRPVYVLHRFTFDLFAVLPQLFNATCFGGSTHQTLSSRSHIESRANATWERRRRFINRLFPLQADHCAEQWAYDVDQAQKTLDRNVTDTAL